MTLLGRKTMPVHDWQRASAGIFHDFHNTWIVELKRTLNEGLLPQDFYAISEQYAGQVHPDVLTLRTDRPRLEPHPERGMTAVVDVPPKVSTKMIMDETAAYALRRRTLVIRYREDHQIVAMVEILSAGNKDRRTSLQLFVDEVVSALQHGYHLLVIDLHPPTLGDPNGIHGAVWDEVGRESYELPSERPLTLVAYEANTPPCAYVEPTGVGFVLPDMPLFLQPGWYINVPLERTCMAAYRGVPQVWRDVIDGQAAA